MKNKVAYIALVGSLVLTGCNDPKEANESNFEVGIQRFLDSSFPACVIKRNFPAENGGFNFGNDFKVFDEMTKLGLLSKTEEMKKLSKYSKPSNVAIYNLTDAGRKFYQPAVAKSLGGDKLGGFCFGKAKVKEIVDFTQPADMFGATVSKVNFTFTVSGIPDWASRPEITSLSEPIKKMVEATQTPIKTQADMVLTNKGWKHHQQDILDNEKDEVNKP